MNPLCPTCLNDFYFWCSSELSVFVWLTQPYEIKIHPGGIALLFLSIFLWAPNSEYFLTNKCLDFMQILAKTEGLLTTAHRLNPRLHCFEIQTWKKGRLVSKKFLQLKTSGLSETLFLSTTPHWSHHRNVSSQLNCDWNVESTIGWDSSFPSPNRRRGVCGINVGLPVRVIQIVGRVSPNGLQRNATPPHKHRLKFFSHIQFCTRHQKIFISLPRQKIKSTEFQRRTQREKRCFSSLFQLTICKCTRFADKELQ